MGNAARLGLVAALVVGAACSRAGLHASGKDAATKPADAIGDLLVENPPVLGDAAADATAGASDSRLDIATLGRDSFAADRAIDGVENPDGTTTASEAGSDRPGTSDAAAADGDVARDAYLAGDLPAGKDVSRREAGVDGGSPAACTGTLALGLPPLVAMGDNYRESIAIADLDGDGKLDIVGAGKGVSVRLGLGDDTFAAPTDYATNVYPAAVVVGDLNGDGKPDIVTANDGSSTVNVMLGKGDGTFAADVAYVTGEAPSALAMADLNHDGKPDLVTVNSGSTLSILLGKGDGSFAPKSDYTANGMATAVALGDVDGDGNLDLVLAIGSAPLTLSVALGAGDGTFGVSRGLSFQSSLGLDGAYVAVGDLNGDGKLDIAVTVGYSGEVAVLLGKGGGAFAAAVDVATSGDSVGIVLRDVNDDRKLDIITAGTGRGVRVILGQGDGSFATAVDYPLAGRVQALAVDDVNGDGKPDIAFATYDNKSWVGWLWGQGDGTFTRGEVRTYNAGSISESVALGDLDGDGELDLAITNATSVGVQLGNGDGSFSAVVEYPSGKNTRAVALGDVDGDSVMDLVAVDSATSSVNLLMGKGDGTFAAMVAHATGQVPTALALADVNHDGVMDVVTANSGSSSFSKGKVSVLLGAGGGELTDHVDYQVGVNPVALALGDLNADGKPDIAVANAGVDGQWSIGILLGKGDGTFAPETEFPSGFGPNSIALGDLNADGKPDIVAANSAAATSVSVLLGKGDGTFATKVEYMTAERPHSAALGDVEGDGRLDVVTANRDSNTMSVLLGNGDGTFAPALEYAFGANIVVLGDVNRDGRLDAVTDTAVLLGTCR